MIGHWILSVAIASNQLVNALTGGDPQMSLSARAAYARDHGSRLARVWCATLDKFDHHHPDARLRYLSGSDHCDIAIVDYLNRKSKV